MTETTMTKPGMTGQTTTGPTRVVIVEDDFLNARYFQIVCEDFGAEVLGMAATRDDAVRLILATRPTHVLMDMRLRGPGDGVDAALEVFERLPETRIIFITGSNEPATLQRIELDHPYRVLIKPIDPDELRQALA
jgi:DNA-binding NarL/FixJ family response regulator